MGERSAAQQGSGRWRDGTGGRVRVGLALAVATLLVAGSTLVAARAPSAPVVALAGSHDRADHRLEATQAPIAPIATAEPTPTAAPTPAVVPPLTPTPTPRPTPTPSPSPPPV